MEDIGKNQKKTLRSSVSVCNQYSFNYSKSFYKLVQACSHKGLGVLPRMSTHSHGLVRSVGQTTPWRDYSPRKVETWPMFLPTQFLERIVATVLVTGCGSGAASSIDVIHMK